VINVHTQQFVWIGFSFASSWDIACIYCKILITHLYPWLLFIYVILCLFVWLNYLILIYCLVIELLVCNLVSRNLLWRNWHIVWNLISSYPFCRFLTMLERKFQLQLRRSDLQIFLKNVIYNCWLTDTTLN